MKASISLNAVIQQSIFAFYLFYCNLKEKEHIIRKINSTKKMLLLADQYNYC